MAVTLEQVLAAAGELEPWKRRAVCAATAERWAVIFRTLGRPSSQQTFEAAIDALWSSVASGTRSDFAMQIRRLPEANQDDSHHPEYYAGRTLEILWRALKCTGADGASKCIDCAASLADDFDTIVTAAPGQTFRYDPKNPPPPGNIQSQELAAQAGVLDSLRAAAAADEAVIEKLRREARDHGARVAAVLPGVLRRM